MQREFVESVRKRIIRQPRRVCEWGGPGAHPSGKRRQAQSAIWLRPTALPNRVS